LIENQVIINSWSQNDTTSVQPFTIQDIVVNYNYNIVGDTIYIITDSLNVTSLILSVEYTQSVYTVYEGLKCGYLVKDTVHNTYTINNYILLNSDTVLISHTVTAYPFGIDETEKIAGVKIYPNPTTALCTLEFSNELKDIGPFNIRIFNNAGQQIWETQIAASENIRVPIDGQHFPSGLYTVYIQGNKSSGSTRLVISR
jgi:hypothetical protein